MTLLRSPDGTWTGEVVLPVDVVNLKTRGYTEVEPELTDVESDVVFELVPDEVETVTVTLVESVGSVDKPGK